MLDAVGLIPEAEGVTKVFENTAGSQIARAVGNSAGLQGVVATQYGMKVVEQGKGGAALVGGAIGLADSSAGGRVSAGLAVAGFVPGLGSGVAVVSMAFDGYRVWKEIDQCH